MMLWQMIACGILGIVLAVPQSQKPLTNADIIQMVKAGFDEETILKTIAANKPAFDTSVQGLMDLKNANVSTKIINAVLASATPAGQPAPGAAPPAQPGATNFPTDVGVYMNKDNQWVEIQPEVVNWKTGGVLKSIATAGIVKGDINGRIIGAHSRITAMAPMEFLIVAPEGVAITEYQLIHLRGQRDAREFRTVTGGVLHVSGGATRDLEQFEGTKVASRTFSVKLPTLSAGEYGFLPPAALAGSGGAGGAGSIGKMYTFRVGE